MISFIPQSSLFAMRSSLVFVFLALLVYLSQAEDIRPAKESVFVQTLKKLYRGPPISKKQSRAEVKTEWIEQKLDNFDENEERTWEMRYMVNDEHFVEGGPMFIFLGGEWEISAGSIQGGLFYDLAKQHNGMLYYTEHRYYGKSWPTSDITVENLKYLDIKQALADLAAFIKYQRANNAALANSKVIMAGGSYSATMVVWFKRLYPELLAGGWASSAPIFAKVDFKEYKEVVGEAILELSGEKCYTHIQDGITELEQMFADNRGAEVKAMLKICNNFDESNDLDIWSLFGSISNIFASVVQYQEEGDVPYICDYLLQFEDPAVAISKLVFAAGYYGDCLDFTYKDTVSYYLDSTYAYGASRPWMYQTCNEYGWYQTSTSKDQPFGTKFPLTLYTTLCYDIFGNDFTNEQIDKHAAETNEYFGGWYPEVENVYMTHGALDPWSAMGLGVEQGAAVVPRASHCADTGSISDSDSAEMRATKERLVELVAEWLAD